MSEAANGEARAGTGHYRILDALCFALALAAAQRRCRMREVAPGGHDG
jgi:hypothetical protein